MLNNNSNNGLSDRIPPTIPVLKDEDLDRYLMPLQEGKDTYTVQPLTSEQIQTIVGKALLDNLSLRVGDELGQGGFATVYALEDQNAGKQYALKVLDPLVTSVHRFLRDKQQARAKISRYDVDPLTKDYKYFFERGTGEVTIGQAINETQCPNLMPYAFFCEADAGEILELGYNRIIWLIGMPRMCCLPAAFNDIQEKVGITEPLILKCGVDLCYALETMHKMGQHTAITAQRNQKNGNRFYVRPDHPEKCLIHRDVKPGNIYIRIQNVGQDESAYSIDFVLADYGISRILGKDQQATMIGHDVFKAPELSINQKVTPTTDLYSVATVMLWLLWKGHEAETLQQLRNAGFQLTTSAAPPNMPYEDILSLLDKVWYNTLARTEIRQDDKANFLKIASRGICQVDLLQQLLDMRNFRSADRPWQSAEEMRSALELYRLALTTPLQENTALQKEQQKVQDLQKETEDLRQKYAAMKQQERAWALDALNRAEENQALQRQVNQLADEMEDLRQKGVPQQEEMQKETDNLRRENENLKQQRDYWLHEWTTKNEIIEAKLKIKMDALRFARDKLDAETKKQEMVIKVLRRQVDDQQAEIQTLSQERDAFASQAAAAQQAADEASQQDFASQAAAWKDRYLKLRKELKEALDEKRAQESEYGAIILSESLCCGLLSLVGTLGISFFPLVEGGAYIFLLIIFALTLSFSCCFGITVVRAHITTFFDGLITTVLPLFSWITVGGTVVIVAVGIITHYFDVPSLLMQFFGLG